MLRYGLRVSSLRACKRCSPTPCAAPATFTQVALLTTALTLDLPHAQIPFFALEAGKLAADPALDLNPFIFITNALAAFGECSGAGSRLGGCCRSCCCCC